MKKITVADTLSLSIPERIQLVEDIWDSIAADAESVELTEMDKKIIDERLAQYRANPGKVSPWQEIYERITSKK